MDVIISAFISALITGVLGPVLTLVIQKKLKNIELPRVSKERINRIRGVWKGHFKQIVSGQEETIKVKVILKTKGRYIEGEAQFQNFHNNSVSLLLYNGIFDGNILKIEYKNELLYILQNGTVVAEMNTRGNIFEGKYIGYAPEEKKIIGGEVYFKKDGEK